MKTHLFLTLAGSLTIGVLSAVEPVLLKNPAPELPLRIQTSTIAKGGRASSTVPTGTTSQTIDITRKRHIERTMRNDALGGEVTYRILQDVITTAVNGKTENKTGPLEAKSPKARKNGAGNWTFSLEGTALGEAADDLEMLGAFENRKWLPERKVAIGESWNFEPSFIRRSLQRDIPNPQVTGVMKLREIGTAPDGTRQAIIDCFIRGGGRSETPTGATVTAETGLVGNLTVNLDQPGRMRFYLNGKLATGVAKPGDSAKVMMPLNLSVTINPIPKLGE
ncbi:MAG: hypothetical protein AAGI48_09990 [Verrucomicrobiota bacterium]